MNQTVKNDFEQLCMKKVLMMNLLRTTLSGNTYKNLTAISHLCRERPTMNLDLKEER